MGGKAEMRAFIGVDFIGVVQGESRQMGDWKLPLDNESVVVEYVPEPIRNDSFRPCSLMKNVFLTTCLDVRSRNMIPFVGKPLITPEYLTLESEVLLICLRRSHLSMKVNFGSWAGVGAAALLRRIGVLGGWREPEGS